jgi:hypothetical protein
MKKQYLAGIAAFNQEAARLHALMDQDPAQALSKRSPRGMLRALKRMRHALLNWPGRISQSC